MEAMEVAKKVDSRYILEVVSTGTQSSFIQEIFIGIFQCTGYYIFICIDFREREGEGKREKETSICCSTYLCIHCLIFVYVLTWD